MSTFKHPVIQAIEKRKKPKNTSDKKTTNKKIFKWAQPNKLHKFASYTPLWTLSALSQAEIQEPKMFWNSRPHDIIIRSAGLGDANSTHQPAPLGETVAAEVKKVLNKRAKLAMDDALNEYKKQRDLYFESVRVSCLPYFNDDRPLTSVTRIEMVVNEPMGISLLKRIRAAAANNGFVDHVDAPYLLTLEFRGWNEKGQEMSKEETEPLKRVIPVKIVNMQLNVSQNGTVYNLRAIPYNEFGYLDRFAWLRTTGQLTKDAKFADTIKEFEDLLNTQIRDEKNFHHLIEEPDEYVFKVHPDFGSQRLTISKMIGSVKMHEQNAPPGMQDNINKKLVGQIKQGDSVMTILRSLTKMLPGLGDEVYEKWQESVKGTRIGSFNERNPNERAKMAFGDDFHFKYFQIRTSVVPQKNKWDRLRKTHPKIVTYYIEPIKINGYTLAIPGVQSGPEQLPFVYKAYNYIFTGENVDILDLNIDYKVAYYQAKLKNIETKNTRRTHIVESHPNSLPIGDEGLVDGDDFITKGEVSNVTSAGTAMNGESSGIVDQFIDSLTHPTADMVRVEMQVLGDVAYMGQAQFMPPSFKRRGGAPGTTSVIDTDGDIDYFRGSPHALFNTRIGCYNPDVADPVISLDFRFPTDRDTSTGLYELSKEESATFSGLYRVVKVDNVFENGQFTQNLHMVRFLNQGDTVTESIELDKIATKIDFTKVARVNPHDQTWNAGKNFKTWLMEKNKFKRASTIQKEIMQKVREAEELRKAVDLGPNTSA